MVCLRGLKELAHTDKDAAINRRWSFAGAGHGADIKNHLEVKSIILE